MNITDAQKQQFQEEGYFILENVIPETAAGTAPR